MKQTKRLLALLLILLLALAGCKEEATGPEQPTDSPEPPVSSAPVESEEPSEEPSEAPSECVPPESEEPVEQERPYEEDEGLTVAEQEQPAVRRYSALGYSLVYPRSEVTLTDWGEGETYELTDAAGTYLAVSRVGGASINEAVAGLQFEYAIESEPTGFIFGTEGYAGVRMTVTAGGLNAEYILYQGKDTIYLVERAIFTGGEDYADLLQAMLDSITVE